MPNNIYAAPNSIVEDREEDAAGTAFYVVSQRKFILLFIASLGLYQIYWFYMNWRRQKITAGLAIQPALRGIFAIFFTHALFKRIDAQLETRGLSLRWSPNAIASAYVVLSLASAMQDRFAAEGVSPPLSFGISLLFLGAIMLILLPVQRTINTVCSDPEGKSNNSLGYANIVWLILGGVFWLLILLGLIS
ncbi:MAG: hypothetical protein FWD62_04735 [Betaproteobacteria bacterium]|nr:hypothetical protein [Betaproteobacteria bacterium]